MRGRRGGNQRLGKDRCTQSRARKCVRRVHAARFERDLRQEARRLSEREERIVEFLLTVHQEKWCFAQRREGNTRNIFAPTGDKSECRAHGMRGREGEQQPLLEKHIS